MLKSIACGLLMPVMTLLVMVRGASLGSLSLVIGIYSMTVVFMEFPSGVFCDLFGRKKTL